MLLLLLSSVLSFSYVQAPIVAMRESPSADSEVVSQAIFAEEITVLEAYEDWVKIETKEDGCAGWIGREAIVERETAYADCSCITPLVEVTSLEAGVYAHQDLSDPPLFILPFECRLEAIDPYNEPDCSWITLNLPNDSQAYIQKKDVTCDIHAMTKEELAAFSKRFVHLPFAQGGRSSFGYDHAGFVQMLYRQIGLSLPRHVQDQCNWEGFESISIDECETGDLIFWGDSASNIHHVGMYVGDQRFIHSTTEEHPSCIRLSDLNEPLYQRREAATFWTARRLKQ